MEETNESNVSITFDGLLRFAIDDVYHLCRAEVHTAAPGHVMCIKIKVGKQVIDRKIFSAKELKDLQSIHIFIGKGDKLEPADPSAKDNGRFENILDLAGRDFYQSPRNTKPGMYGCSIWLHNGEVGAGDETDFKVCSRVRQDLFGKLKFVWKNEHEWSGFKDGVQHMDLNAIKDLEEFARNVSATLSLADGEALCIKNGKTGELLFDPLKVGQSYEVIIKYADVELPQTLADCKGFAHHSEALILPVSAPIFGIFKPASFKDSQLEPVTEPGCCDCARMGGPTSLLKDFQAQWPPSSATRAVRPNID